MALLAETGHLSAIPLFQGIEPGYLTRLAELLHAKTFPTGAIIMTAEQPGEALYVLLEGTVKVCIDKEDGTELILALQGAGDVVGEMSLLDSAGRSANVVAMEPCSLVWMDRMAFKNALNENQRLSHNLLRVLTARLRVANEQLLSLSSLDVTGRVARQLLAFADRYGKTDDQGVIHIPLRLTQSDIAGLVGASRERVNHAIVVFKQGGAVSVDDRFRFAVHNRGALAQRCQ